MAIDPVYPEAIEPDDFWDQHKNKIIGYTVIALLVILGYGSYALISQKRASAARQSYAEASDAAAFEAVIRDYPGTIVAGNASLRLAEALREEKKFEEAITVLNEFIAKQPQHPLIATAWNSLGVTQELAGKTEEALLAYQETASKYPDAYTAPIALNSQARLLAAQGKKEEARQILQDVVARFPETAFAYDARRELRFRRP